MNPLYFYIQIKIFCPAVSLDTIIPLMALKSSPPGIHIMLNAITP